MFMYITYEQPFVGKSFTEHQIHNIYHLMIDKTEYPTFDGWIWDMLRSGVYEKKRYFGSIRSQKF